MAINLENEPSDTPTESLRERTKEIFRRSLYCLTQRRKDAKEEEGDRTVEFWKCLAYCRYRHAQAIYEKLEDIRKK